MKNIISDVLADRYASSAMVAIWSPEGKIRLERRLWIAALCAQRDLGMTVPPGAIVAYERVIDVIDLASIAAREAKTRHDVKARIEEFNALAGYQLIHLGFTSRDLTDNVEQLQIFQSLKLVYNRTVAVLRRLGSRAAEYRLLDICGRSHNVPGQTTTLGKRFANCAGELLIAFERLEHLIATYPLRGIKGPMGTQQDMADLLDGKQKAIHFEERIREHLGIPRTLQSVGQVYPRSLDFEVVSVLSQLASSPANFAKLIRLMAGHELVIEGFTKDQTASSGMPHKINSRTCERINGMAVVLGGFLHMTQGLLGDQWNEGDVSCSVVRRIALPGAFFAIDGVYESTMTVLDEMVVFPGMIKSELRHYLPFLLTTRLLMAAVKKGMGRETAHGIIKTHATAAMNAIREGKPNAFVDLLAADVNFPLGQAEIKELLANPNHGLAEEQVDDVGGQIAVIVAQHSEAAAYNPEPIR